MASPDGRHLAAGGSAGIVYIWDADSGRELVQLDGRRLITGSPVGEEFFLIDS